MKYLRLFESDDDLEYERVPIFAGEPDSDTSPMRETWRNSKGQLHRLNGPAKIEYYSGSGKIFIEEWYKNGKPNREDGPARTDYYPRGEISSRVWYKEGFRHRVDGPARIEYRPDGSVSSQAYFLDGRAVTLEELDSRNPNSSEERLIEIYLRNNEFSDVVANNPNFPKYIKDWLIL